MINLSSLTSNQLKRAAAIKDQIEVLHQELANLTGEETAAPVAKPARKKISAAGIAKIKAAQKARWAKVRAAKTSGTKPTAKVAAKPAGKKKMSAAARAKIAAAAKARWAAVKAAGKKKL